MVNYHSLPCVCHLTDNLRPIVGQIFTTWTHPSWPWATTLQLKVITLLVIQVVVNIVPHKHMSLQIWVIKINHKWSCHISWIKSLCKSHLHVVVVSTWCHILFFATKILCDLSKVTRGIYIHMWHLRLKNNWKY